MLSGWEAGAGGDNFIQGSITIFKQTEKIQVWSQQLDAAGQSCGSKGGAIALVQCKGRRTSPRPCCLEHRVSTLAPASRDGSRAQEATGSPDVLFLHTRKKCCPGSISPKQVRSYGQAPRGLSEAGAGHGLP